MDKAVDFGGARIGLAERTLRTNLLPATEMGALAAKRRAKRRDAAATSVCATSLTRPRRSASAAVMRSPEKRMSLALVRPTWRSSSSLSSLL
jgi:hypothetical protein